MIFRLKLEIDELVTEMVGKLPESLFISDSTTFLDPSMAGGQFVQAIEFKLRNHGHSDANIKKRVFGVEKSLLRVNYAVNSRKLVGSYTVDTKDIPDIFMNMKFDAIVGNPPYQKAVGERKTEPLWHIFVENSIKSLKDGGYLCYVHPSGWRDVDGRFKDIGNLLKSKNILYLEMHSDGDGKKTFNATIPYDWYVLRNVNSKNNTLVKFQDGDVRNIDLDKIPFIPNGGFDKIMSLIAKPGEETVEVIYDRSMYGTDKSNMSDTQTETYKHPIVYTIKNTGVPNLWFSSEKKGHFGVSKFVWCNGKGTGVFVDNDGTYGLSQFTYAIVDKPKNLEHIKKAITSNKFKKLIEDSSTNGTINRRVLSLFRKDFWKDFV